MTDDELTGPVAQRPRIEGRNQSAVRASWIGPGGQRGVGAGASARGLPRRAQGSRGREAGDGPQSLGRPRRRRLGSGRLGWLPQRAGDASIFRFQDCGVPGIRYVMESPTGHRRPRANGRDTAPRRQGFGQGTFVDRRPTRTTSPCTHRFGCQRLWAEGEAWGFRRGGDDCDSAPGPASMASVMRSSMPVMRLSAARWAIPR